MADLWGSKGFHILVSIILFTRLSLHYCYRQWDEIVNVQGMIEDIYEKRVNQDDEHKELLSQNIIVNNKIVDLP